MGEEWDTVGPGTAAAVSCLAEEGEVMEQSSRIVSQPVGHDPHSSHLSAIHIATVLK